MANNFQLPLCRGRGEHVLHRPSLGGWSHVLVYMTVSVALLTSRTVGADRCRSNQFECRDGSCILQAKMCDGRRDCADNSDERDCGVKLCMKPNWFQCSSPHGACLAAELVCNGIENCPSGEDELECMGHSRGGTGGWHDGPHNCTRHEYTCQSDKSCIPLDFMCDGKRDCNDGSDESVGCLKAESSCRGFFCQNKHCLESKKWMCDGFDDCGDGSDEHHCAWNCTPLLGKFMCRNNITCLPLDKVCDGKADCQDGSDESLLCNSSVNCSSKNCPPMAKCQMLPQIGPECICPKGFRHSLLDDACVDINECLEQYGVCSQRCENTSGGYKCLCDKGYTLASNNHTCEANGEEALLLYTTQVTVMGIQLRSKRVHTIAKNLTKVIGVAYDGANIYWTNIQNEAESIVKANIDGTQQEILLTSGLDAPEDLAVDWLTGNIYFSDNVMHHIAVCTNDGRYCTVLVTVDVHQPRGIVVWPQQSQLFWTDWGIKPMIARASMDGSNSLALITENIHWPNGIALDMHNERIYWTDAKLAVMESVRSDGTDRRVVLAEILQHPYGLALFEDKIYWSDWGTKSVHSCHKFTGKGHEVVVRDRTIYAVHVYHPSKQPKMAHSCEKARCSHLCLLAENNGYTCACPDGMELATDHLRCLKTHKKQRLFVGIRNSLLEMEHTNFGRHTVTETHQLTTYIHHMAYNSVNGSIFIVDNMQRAIVEYDLRTKTMTTLVRGNLGNVTGLAFDHLSRNVYWSDSKRHVVEVFSLQTHQRAIVSFFFGVEAPIGIALVPEDGVMFIALRSRRHVHIDQKSLSGRGEHSHIFEDELGDDDIKFAPDYETNTLYWSDSDLGRISFSDYRSFRAYTFRSHLNRPYSLAIVDEDLFWSELRSNTIHWTHKTNLAPIKHFDIEVNRELYGSRVLPAHIPILASTPPIIAGHPCQHWNGGCSHVCVTLGKSSRGCLCPAGLVFKDSTNTTCIEALDCEFRCRSGECLTLSRRCNGRRDCPDGSDEELCDPTNTRRPKIVCAIGEFTCHNAEQCIDGEKRCDGHKDCRDGSDEDHCAKFDKTKKCHRHQHPCDNGNCVDLSVMCDGANDCGDNSDEVNCKLAPGEDVNARPACGKDMFQCDSGTCIAKGWECDGKLDCPDGSDEHDKCSLRECPANMHKCLLGQCIEMRLVCDGHNDCGDRSDELNCDLTTGKKQHMTCGDKHHPMLQCASDASVCLELSAKCNGTAECPRGEDEANCGDLCSIYEFQCKTSKECIRVEFRCDHEKDCADGSDEANCGRSGGWNGTTASLADHAHEHSCAANMFDCKDGQCVDLSRVCDQFPDCETGADEGPLCKTACKALSGKPLCENKCRPTPSGAICSCFQGYRLDSDQRSCIDINECEELDPCAQICENSHGSYRCSCYPDFMLRTDKTTCKSIESRSSLLFSTYNEVRNMTELPIVLRVAWTANDSKINGFDLNVRQRSAYFSTDSENVLYKVDVESGTVKAALAVTLPTKVAVDWITDNVYVVSRAKVYKIMVCSFAAKMCGSIVRMRPHESIKSVAVDAFNRRLFYAIIHAQSFAQPRSQIAIANLDGSKREWLLTKEGVYITALACDPYKRQLYYTDLHRRTLQVISYRPGSKRSPLTLIQKGSAIMHPSGLTWYENQAFIVNMGAKEAVRCQLFGQLECKAFSLNILNAEHILVDGASRQPLRTNPCGMAKCSGMCIQAEHSYECLCGDMVVSESQPCPRGATNEISSSALLVQAPTHDKVDSSHTATIGTLVFLALALLSGAIGYFYYRRMHQGHRDFNRNLHFQNPLSSFLNGGGKSATLDSTGTDGSSGTTAASFEVEREKLYIGSNIQRFLHGSTSSNGSEILLETAPPQEEGSLAPNDESAPLPRITVEDRADCDNAQVDGSLIENAQARLVP